MRVLHVLASLSPRLGGPANVLGLARAVARQGCDVSIFATDIDEWGRLWPWQRPRRLSMPTDRPIMDQGVSVRYFPVCWPSRYACSWKLSAALRNEIATFDLVHIHSLYLFHGFAAAHHCRKNGIPYVIRPHGSLDRFHRGRHRWRKAIYSRLFELRNIAGAAALHYTSVAEAEHARAAGITVPGFVVSLGIDAAEYAELPARGIFRAAHPELNGRRLVVFLGRITPKKGLDLLIPAVGRLSTFVPDLHLVLAGQDDEGYLPRVKQLIERHDLVDRVTWVGFVSGVEKRCLLRDADVWALPSYDENFAVAAVEAMASGAPVLISDRVGIHRVVSEREAGLVVEATVEAVAEGLERILTDGSLRQRLAANARALAFSEFTWDAAATHLIQEYRAILARRGAEQGAGSLGGRSIASAANLGSRADR